MNAKRNATQTYGTFIYIHVSFRISNVKQRVYYCDSDILLRFLYNFYEIAKDLWIDCAASDWAAPLVLYNATNNITQDAPYSFAIL